MHVREVQHDAFSFIVLSSSQTATDLYCLSSETAIAAHSSSEAGSMVYTVGLSCPSCQDIHSNPISQSFPADFHVGLFLVDACFPCSCS